MARIQATVAAADGADEASNDEAGEEREGQPKPRPGAGGGGDETAAVAPETLEA
jgi:hypothetical protein